MGQNDRVEATRVRGEQSSTQSTDCLHLKAEGYINGPMKSFMKSMINTAQTMRP